MDRATAIEWTAVDLARRFGPIPLSRVCTHPAPGLATEADVIAANDRRLGVFELCDGVLVEKSRQFADAYPATALAMAVSGFARPRGLGIVVGPGAPYRLGPGLIRLPDVSYIPRDRFPERRLPRAAICPIIPALVAEVLRAVHTKKERQDRLGEYFACGVLLVWSVDPEKKAIRAYTAPDRSRLVRESQTLDGGDVLPGFSLRLRDLFADPMGEALAT